MTGVQKFRARNRLDDLILYGGFAVWYLLHVSPLAPRISGWRLEFWKIYTPLYCHNDFFFQSKLTALLHWPS